MNTPYIASFVAVVKAGSFTVASQSLGTSKSRLSQQVSQLERTLGVQLLHRTTRTLRLTEIGEAFYQQCAQGITLIDAAIIQAQQDQTHLKGKIRLSSVGGAIGEELVAPAVIAFMQQHPDIQVELDFTSTHAKVIEEQYDGAFRMGKLKDSCMIGRHLISLRSYICAAPSLVARIGYPTTPKDLEKMPWIYGSISRSTLTRKGRTTEYVPKNYFQCRNGHVMKRAAMTGLGVARLASIYAKTAIEQGSLIELLPEWQAPSHDLALVYPPYRYKLKRVEALVEFIVEYFRTHTDSDLS